jgi:hypothetical protein
MSRLAPQFKLSSSLDRFLYAPIAEDANGTVVTVLSALARQDLDPWDEAADLNLLSRSSAIQRLTLAIAALPFSAAQRENPAVVATRLVALLPQDGPPHVESAQPVEPAIDSRKLTLTMLGLVALLLVQWLIFRNAVSELPDEPAPTSGSVMPAQIPASVEGH